MKILVAVEMKVPDSPILVTHVEMKTPKTESDRTRAAVAFLDLKDQILEQTITLTNYQVKGRHKTLKSIRCPHCKFNYSRDGVDVLKLEGMLRKNKDEQEIIRCVECKELYMVRRLKDDRYEMEW